MTRNTRRIAPIALAAAALLSGCALGGNAEVVSRYCHYGSVSEAQESGCENHVTAGDITQRTTPAARYARKETNECGIESGPLCSDP